MPKTFIFIVILINTNITLATDTSQTQKYQLKAYINNSYYFMINTKQIITDNTRAFRNETNYFQTTLPSIAIAKRLSNRVNLEFEIINFNFHNRFPNKNNTIKSNQFFTKFRFETFWKINNFNNKNLIYIGTGVKPFFYISKSKDNSNSINEARQIQHITSISLIPRFQRSLKSGRILDVNLPIQLIEYDKTKYTSKLYNGLFERLTILNFVELRIGIGINL